MPIDRTSQEYRWAVRECIGGIPTEDDMWLVNAATREQLAAFYTAHGAAWLGRTNLYHGAASITPYDPEMLVHNFEADFAVPVEDAELVRLIQARDDAPYTGTKADLVWLKAIGDRIDVLGGIHLFWA